MRPLQLLERAAHAGGAEAQLRGTPAVLAQRARDMDADGGVVGHERWLMVRLKIPVESAVIVAVALGRTGGRHKCTTLRARAVAVGSARGATRCVGAQGVGAPPAPPDR